MAIAIAVALLPSGFSCLTLSAAEPKAEPKALHEAPKFEITTKRADDAVKVDATADKASFDVRSPFGISEATITRTGKDWPTAISLRLHLSGLEHFEVNNGKMSIHASAPSTGEFKPRVWRDKDEKTTLTEKNGLWLNITRSVAKQPAITDKPGGNDSAQAEQAASFEIVLPKAMFEHNPKTITLRWIDFYRG